MHKLKQTGRVLCALLALALLLPCSAAFADATETHTVLENIALSVDGAEPVTVKALHYSYGNNRFVSLRDLAAALSGTAKRFGMTITNDVVILNSGTDYSPVGGEGEPFPSTEPGALYYTRPLAENPIELDGRALRYLSFFGMNTASRQDCFMSLTDLAMQLDLDLSVSSGTMTVNTASPWHIDLEELENEGFYYEIHSALIGDASTGLIYTGWETELPVPIASTTKLMTFVVLMDAVKDGEISLEDTVTITEESVQLSRTQDGTIYMETGWQVTVPDLLCGMLLRSSNECALALAIHLSGSEAAFVERMNRKAQALSLSGSAVFYNCHGLPVYTDNLAATKIQNRMTARDMFQIVSYLLRTYPEVTNITALKVTDLGSLRTTVYNTNPLLFNLPGVVGLKTGTTNMSGSCLVTALEAQDAEGQTHMLTSIVFGAEDSATRNTLSEELLRYGMQCLREDSFYMDGPPRTPPADAETLIRRLLEKY